MGLTHGGGGEKESSCPSDLAAAPALRSGLASWIVRTLPSPVDPFLYGGTGTVNESARNVTQLLVRPYIDGGLASAGVREVADAWSAEWGRSYHSGGDLVFLDHRNLNDAQHRGLLPEIAQRIGKIRNPDALFVAEGLNLELGNLEVTVHSPDGSNIEKRYPLLYASRRNGVDAIVATPYQKWRSRGQSNRLPNRHATRNLDFLRQWDPCDPADPLVQILPIAELHGAELGRVDASILPFLPTWTEVGEFLAHRSAQRLGIEGELAAQNLSTFKGRLEEFHKRCIENTTDTNPSSLLKMDKRWIQVYNTRPETGHWERGEGQFDSIDGRLMFTIDEIDLLKQKDRPDQFDFLLPQFSSGHPWVVEQVKRGYGSKRFRNICKLLPDNGVVEFSVRFADLLDDEDWELLRSRPELCLERLDLNPGVYSLADLLDGTDIPKIAAAGLRAANPNDLEPFLSDGHLYWSTHRAYYREWEESLLRYVTPLPRPAQVLCPRLPGPLLRNVAASVECQIIPAEGCSKLQLLALRQISRFRSG